MSSRAKNVIRFTFAFILVVLTIYFTIKDVDLYHAFQIAINANYFWALASMPVILLSHWMRAYRWKTMLKPVVPNHKISTLNLFSAVMIGYAVNNIIPRGGEFLRPYIYARREGISFSSSFATIVVERVIDLLFLILLFASVFMFFREQIIVALPNIHPQNILIPTFLVIAVLLLTFYPPFLKKLLKYLIKPFSKKFYDKVFDKINKFLLGFEIIKTPSKYLQLTYESLLIWILYTIPLYFMFFAFNFIDKYGMNFSDAILLIVVSGIGVTIAPTPGAIGVYHYLISNTLIQIYKVVPEEAIAYATVTHALNYLLQVVPGGIFFLSENIKKIPVNIEEINNENETNSSNNFYK